MAGIQSKTDRATLKPRREPYWARLSKGTYIGFRRLDTGDGTWIARWRDDDGKQHYRALGHFEDFDAAAKSARRWAEHNDQGANPAVTTVEGACAAYVDSLRTAGRENTAKDAEGRFKRYVNGTRFGNIPLDRLKTSDVSKWVGSLIEKATKAGDEEDLRRAKDSANRYLATLKAALNRALKDRLVANDSGWRTVEAFKKVGASRRNAFLTLAERQALVANCEDDLALLVKAMLLTGSRPGELAALNASDYDRKTGYLTLRGKTGSRTVALSTAAIEFFSEQAKERIGNAPMLPRAFGGRWAKDAWKKPFKEAATKTGLSEDVVLYSLRHTAISEMVMAGMDSFIVAKVTGTSVAMIESNYGHLRHDKVTAKLDLVKMV